MPAAYVPDQAHENLISVLKVLELQAAATKLRVPDTRQQLYQQLYNGSPVGLPRHPNKHGTDDREIISTFVGQCRRHFSDHIHHRLEAWCNMAVSRISDGPVAFCNDNPTWQDETSPPYPSRLI